MSLQCNLCFRNCVLEEGKVGFCKARANQGGRVVPVNYGKITGLALDPIEKKPLHRFHPGSKILSVGSFGCNLRCPFCQNHEISMVGAEGFAEEGVEELSPSELTDMAKQLCSRGNIGLAYTYNEPLVGYEFVRDCAELVHQAGMYNVLVTNGTIEEEPWLELLPLLDAVNIDLKGFTQNWYRQLGGDLETVKRNITLAARQCHVEVTTLLVTDKNDSVDEVADLARWLASVDPGIPLHLSRFFPQYRMTDRRATPVERVYGLAREAEKYLKYVYVGNC